MGEDKQRVRQKAIEVCSYMEGWKLDDSKDLYGTVLLSDSGRGLFFQPIWSNADRVEISGYFGDLRQFLTYEKEKTTITVGMAKTPERIAKDIEKRLLPAYERMFIKATEGKRVHDEYEKEKRAVLEAVRDAIGGDAHVIQDDRVISYHPFRCDVKISGHEVELRLTLPLVGAIIVLGILGEQSEGTQGENAS